MRCLMTLDSDYDWFNKDVSEMTFDKYQQIAGGTAIYDEKYKVFYPALGLAGEAGEVANKVKKLMRDSVEHDIAGEIGDVLWYVAALCSDLDLSMEDVAIKNINKLHSRKERGVISGSGDNR